MKLAARLTAITTAITASMNSTIKRLLDRRASSWCSKKFNLYLGAQPRHPFPLSPRGRGGRGEGVAARSDYSELDLDRLFLFRRLGSLQQLSLLECEETRDHV